MGPEYRRHELAARELRGHVAEPLLDHRHPEEGGYGEDQAWPEPVAKHRYGMAGMLVVPPVMAVAGAAGLRLLCGLRHRRGVAAPCA